MSPNERFNRFWGSREGQDICDYVHSACLPENNEELANALISGMCAEDVLSTQAARDYLLRCQKSIQRILATI